MSRPVLSHLNFLHDQDFVLYDWPISQDSTVVEIGGFQGNWASGMIDKCHPHRMIIFEPQTWAHDRMKNRFSGYNNVELLNYGLHRFNGVFPMGDFNTDGCSLVKNFESMKADNREMGYGNFRNIAQAFDELKLSHIDVCLMNIEGYEFELLGLMRHLNLMERIGYLLVQFHLFAAGPNNHLYDDERSMMDAAYKVRWDYGSTMVSWEVNP